MRSSQALPVRILVKAILFVVLFSMAFSLLMNVPIGRFLVLQPSLPGA